MNETATDPTDPCQKYTCAVAASGTVIRDSWREKCAEACPSVRILEKKQRTFPVFR